MRVDNSSQAVSLVPYIRRLVCTGIDTEAILMAFFGSSWRSGICHIHRKERQNYLFAAKSSPWDHVKLGYDMGSQEMVPCLVTLRDPTEREIQDANDKWSDWLAMQDWQVGPMTPVELLQRENARKIVEDRLTGF